VGWEGGGKRTFDESSTTIGFVANPLVYVQACSCLVTI